MMKRVIAAFALAALAAPAVSHAQSLNEDLRHLIGTNPRILSAQRTFDAARDAQQRAWGAFLPTVDLSANSGYDRVDSPSRRTQGRSPKTLNTDGLTLSLTQNVFDGFRRTSNYDGARIQTSIQDTTLEATRQAVMFEGITAYLDVLRHTQLVDLARKNERTIQQQLNLESERVQRGGGMAVDALFARSRLQIGRERLVAFEGALNDALSRYHQVFGKRAVPELMIDPLPPAQLMPATLEDAIRIAEGGNPNRIVSGLQVDLADKRRTTAASDYYPRVDLVARNSSERNIDGTEGERREFTAFVRVTWELFSGFQTRASVSEAAQLHGAAQNNHGFTSRKVVEETRLAWNEMSVARERVRLLENAVNIASEVFDARDRLRRAGRETAINVLDAENEVYNARINYAQAAYDGRRAIYRLLQAMGMVTPANFGI
ncbi:MAG: TolC family outer membrane protein [Rhodospirillales bacterium]|jgi:adhesin transport system outer membrane protein